MADISIIHKNRSEKRISEIKDGNKQWKDLYNHYFFNSFKAVV